MPQPGGREVQRCVSPIERVRQLRDEHVVCHAQGDRAGSNQHNRRNLGRVVRECCREYRLHAASMHTAVPALHGTDQRALELAGFFRPRTAECDHPIDSPSDRQS